MKKLLMFSLILFASISIAQPQLIDGEYFRFRVGLDPVATYKEKSPNINLNIELIESFFYVSGGMQFLPDLEGGYVDYAGAGGLNFSWNRWQEIRMYGGIRIGTIYRGSSQYPLFGYEGGVDFKVANKVFLGLKGTFDNRKDFRFSGAEPEYLFSGFVVVVIEICKLK